MTDVFRASSWRAIAAQTAPAASMVAMAAAFKLASFFRETTIAAHFGLSSRTDAYFSLQQLPLTLAAFMFGAFAIAISPAYAAVQLTPNRYEWVNAMLAYGTTAGTALTALTVIFSKPILATIAPGSGTTGQHTLFWFSITFVPIIYIGIWAAFCNARNKPRQCLFITAAPYLVMVMILLLATRVNQFSEVVLPLSLSCGFLLSGLYAAVCIHTTEQVELRSWASHLQTFSTLKNLAPQLAASTVENIGFSANQLALVVLVARLSPGSLTLNAYASRVSLLVMSLVAQPVAQWTQARLCQLDSHFARVQFFRRLLPILASFFIVVALILFRCRRAVVVLVYMHGHFGAADVDYLCLIMPPWIVYFVVMALNQVSARYMFTAQLGQTYTKRMILAYLAANLVRIMLVHPSIASYVWCAVGAEGVALATTLMVFYRGDGRQRLGNTPAVAA